MAELLVRDVGAVRRALAEAARTDESSAERVYERFIELRPGVTDKLAARRHHLLTGRRGTGKSTLLHVVRRRLQEAGVAVATVDMERFKGREFPDVLIEILVALFDEIAPPVRFKHLAGDVRLKIESKRLASKLNAILQDPQSLIRRVEKNAARDATSGGSVSLRMSLKGGNAGARLAAARLSTSTHSSEAEFEELKIERLQQLAPQIAHVLAQLVHRSSDQHAIIFIDDYYFVRLQEISLTYWTISTKSAKAPVSGSKLEALGPDCAHSSRAIPPSECNLPRTSIASHLMSPWTTLRPLSDFLKTCSRAY